MANAKVKLELKDKTDSELILYTDNVVTKMTGNGNFTTPNPPLPSITTAKTDFSTSLQAVATLEQQLEAARGVAAGKRGVLHGLLTQEGTYVENTSAGDAVKILSAGMEVRDEPAPPAPLPAPQNFIAIAGANEGDIHLDWDTVKKAKSYELQRSPDPITGTSWIAAGTVTKSKATISGLSSGTKNWFRVRAIGATGPGPWSDPATKIAP